MKNIVRSGVLLLLAFSVLRISRSQDQASVLIAYYSAGGHTRAMAEAVARGARSVKNVTVKVVTVAKATSTDVLSADAIIVGSPVYNANVAPPVQEFINGWPFEGAPLKDKIGAAFVSAGGISAGEEATQMGILRSMLIFGMIVVGGPEWTSPFGASAITVEEPFRSSKDGSQLDDHFLKKAESLGKRVAELALKWKRASK
jgi:NAD(P)H dehydrogenase (quinone)